MSNDSKFELLKNNLKFCLIKIVVEIITQFLTGTIIISIAYEL